MRLILTLVALLVLGGCRSEAQGAPRLLELHFIDVGQGDAVLVRSPTGQNVLIDGRSDDARAYLQASGIQTLDLAIATHADADHIGGLEEVVRTYCPRLFMDNTLSHNTQTYRGLLKAAPRAFYGEVQGDPENGLVAVSALPPLRPLDDEVKLLGRGGALLVSNDPEYLGDSAILPAALYRDELAGSFRVLYHHANTKRADLTLATAVTNTQGAPLLLFARGLGGDTNIYPDVAGQRALSGFLGTRHQLIHLATLAPGESTLVAPHTAGPGDTASALEEYVAVTSLQAERAPSSALVEALTTVPPSRSAAGAKRPELPAGFSRATVTVTVLAYTGTAPEEPQSLPVAPARPPKSVEGTPYYLLGRGTFPFSERHARITLRSSPAMLILNSAVSGPFARAVRGEYLLGTDAVSGRKGFNNGNYGVLYDLRLCIFTNAPLGFPYGFLMQPAGGSGHYAVQAEGDIVRSPFVSYKNGWWFYRALAFGPEACGSLRATLTGGSFGPQKFFFVPFPLFEKPDT